MDSRILVVDDEVDFLQSVRRGLLAAGFKHIFTESDPFQAHAMIEGGDAFDLALIDISMPGMDGLELLSRAKGADPDLEAIMVTAHNDAMYAVDALRKGAYDYLLKPVTWEDLIATIHRALERKRLLEILSLDKRQAVPDLKNPGAFDMIKTCDTKIKRILKEAELHAVSNVPILITGESGTGKGLLAAAIHNASARTEYPFTPINMASLPSELFEAEFYGHTAGAFTGAKQSRIGYVEQTSGGTLFLDEIGTLPLELQGKLLRVLQEGEFMRLGSSSPQTADLRIITATNADLETLMLEGKFRKDLYYRLKGAWLHLPALSERKDDIALLSAHFLSEIHGQDSDESISRDALEILQRYEYPGNIRELRSILHTASNLAQGRPISEKHLPPEVRKSAMASLKAAKQSMQGVVPLAKWEKHYILKIYNQADRNKAVTARFLEIGVNTLRRKLQSYNVS
jgi:two-component system response regulator AtoC